MRSRPILSLAIVQEWDTVLARQRAKQIASLLDFGVQDQARIATTVSELARNALLYAGGGRIRFALDQIDSSQELSVQISDTGPGMPHLEEVLAGQYASPTGLGLGLSAARRLMDTFQVKTSAETGTTVLVGKKLPAAAPPISPGRLEEFAAELIELTPRTPLAEVQQQNQELLQALDALESNRQELLRLNTELVDTNRGIVALYAELDEKAQELQRANRIKSRFLAHMSHEFRTPLNSITALARLLLDRVDGDLSDEQDRQVVFIRRAAGELLELVDGLLDLNKVEAGTMDVNSAPCSIPDILSTLRGMFVPLHDDPRVALVFIEPGPLPLVETDELKVTQILRNFIANALKFTVEGEVRISAGPADGGEGVRFAVSDTGRGIAEADQDRVFEEFAQVGDGLQGFSAGSGLGLTISRKLADLLAGRVSVESVEGVGSTFYLTIPSAGRRDEDGRRDKVLLVDDSDVDRYLLRGLLEGTPYEILEAGNGTEGMRVAEGESLAAIFVDLVMPDQSGVDFLRRLRENPSTRDIPAILVTSQGLDEEEAAAVASLRTRLLSKAIYSERDGAVVAKGVLAEVTDERRDGGDVGSDG